MNAARRSKIRAIVAKLANLREELDDVRSDEQDAFDNLPESLQLAERGETMQEGLTELEEAISELEDLEAKLDDLVSA
jgi:ABC-type transporter Mla subunit MlaD